MHSMENSSTNYKESCSKWSFCVDTLVLVWLVVVVALLDVIAVLGCKELVLPKLKTQLTF